MLDETMDVRVRALEETALAYARRGECVQYDSTDLTYLWKMEGGAYRRTDGLSPEDATKDSYLFSVCSSFIYNCLYQTFGYELCGSPLDHTCERIEREYAAQTIFAYDREAADGVSEKKAVRLCLEALTPGDALLIRQRENSSRHIMLCISGGRIVHCAGGKINLKTGEEKWEAHGAVRVDSIQDYLVSLLGGFPFSGFGAWRVVRLLDAIDPARYPVTPAAQSRLAYPSLNIDRTVSVRRYQTVQPGDCVTLTLRIRNESKEKSKLCFEALPVEERLPEMTELLPASYTADLETDGRTLRWQLSLAPGEARVLQYSVRILPSAKPGARIVFGGGRVAQIRSNEIALPVTAPRPDAAFYRRLRELAASGVPEDAVWKGDGVAEWVYAALGRPAAIPTVSALIGGLYEFSTARYCYDRDEDPPRPILLRRAAPDPAALAAEKMIAAQLVGGLTLACVPGGERVLELRAENLCPGDVIVLARTLTPEACEAEQWTLLGGGRMLRCADGKTELCQLPPPDSLLAAQYFAVLRPYLAG